MGRTTNLTQKMKLFSFGALGLASAQVSCPPYQETWPLTTIKLTQEAIDSGNDGCTAGGHDGQLYSKCWVSCQDGYDMIFKNTGARGAIEETVNERTFARERMTDSMFIQFARNITTAPAESPI